jgi:hypothetical protein
MNGHEIRANGLPTHMQRMPDKHSKVSKKDGSSYRTATVTLFYIEQGGGTRALHVFAPPPNPQPPISQPPFL